MTRAELEQTIITACRESGLGDDEQMSAIARARQRLQKGIRALAPAAQKSYEPLARPSGNLMGKKKREAKDG